MRWNVLLNGKKIDEVEAKDFNDALTKFAYKCKPLKEDGFDVKCGDEIECIKKM